MHRESADDFVWPAPVDSPSDEEEEEEGEIP
jgi:hypothetical protein